PRRPRAQEGVHRPRQLRGLQPLPRRSRPRQALAQLVEHGVHGPAPALLGVLPLIAAEGQVARYLSQKRPQGGRPRRGYGVPRGQIGVVLALLRVGLPAQYASGYAPAVSAVLPAALRHRLAVAREEQLYYPRVVHALTPS